jgi:hypothetical protein
MTGQGGQSTASYPERAADWPPPRGARHAQNQSGRFLRRPGADFTPALTKINGVEPFSYLKATLEAIAAGHPKNRIDDLLPWNLQPPS